MDWEGLLMSPNWDDPRDEGLSWIPDDGHRLMLSTNHGFPISAGSSKRKNFQTDGAGKIWRQVFKTPLSPHHTLTLSIESRTIRKVDGTWTLDSEEDESST